MLDFSYTYLGTKGYLSYPVLQGDGYESNTLPTLQ